MLYSPHSAFTVKYDGISLNLTSDIAITQASDSSAKIESIGLWDTGATRSAISESFASKLGLIPISKAKVRGVGGEQTRNVFLLDLYLPNSVVFSSLPVTECGPLSADDDICMLIGMDVITKGDLCLTNFKGKTVFSFRAPSQKMIDYVPTAKQVIKRSATGKGGFRKGRKR